MKSINSLKILFKSQLIALFVFLLFISCSIIRGKVSIWDSPAILLYAYYFLILSTAVYYTVGILVHRFFLRFKMYNILYIFGLYYILLLAYLIYVINYAHAIVPPISDYIANASLIIIPQLLIIRYLTLRELRKNKQPVISSEA